MGAAGFRRLFPALALLGSCTSVQLGPQSLAGTEWRVTEIDSRPTPGGPDFAMQFQATQWHGGFGCNGMSAEYRLAGNVLTIGRTDGQQFVPGRIMATERDCSSTPTGHFEDEAVAILVKPMTVRFSSAHRMTLANDAGSIELELRR